MKERQNRKMKRLSVEGLGSLLTAVIIILVAVCISVAATSFREGRVSRMIFAGGNITIGAPTIIVAAHNAMN